MSSVAGKVIFLVALVVLIAVVFFGVFGELTDQGGNLTDETHDHSIPKLIDNIENENF